MVLDFSTNKRRQRSIYIMLWQGLLKHWEITLFEILNRSIPTPRIIEYLESPGSNRQIMVWVVRIKYSHTKDLFEWGCLIKRVSMVDRLMVKKRISYCSSLKKDKFFISTVPVDLNLEADFTFGRLSVWFIKI